MQGALATRRVFWLEPDLFDLKPNKSPWLEMSRGLNARGYEVVIVTGYARQPYLPPAADVRFEYVPCIRIPCLLRCSLLLSICIRMMRARRDDIVIVSPSGLIIAPLLRVRGIRNLHLDVRTVPVAVHPVKSRAARLLYWRLPMGRLRQWARGVSFITTRLKESVEKEFHATFDDCVIWESGVDASTFRAKPGNEPKYEGGVRTIFYHGSVGRDRGIDTVVEALTGLDPSYRNRLRFVVVGAGSELRRLKRIVEENRLDDRVVFKGLMPYEAMPGEIAQSDICVCPLPDKPEWNVSSPIKVFEYMASGKPIIVTPIPAHRAVLEGQDFAIWTKGYDADAFREAIVYAIDNAERLIEAAREAAPRFVESHYDWRQQAAKLARYLDGKFRAAAC